MKDRYSIVVLDGIPTLVADPKGEYVSLEEYQRVLDECERCLRGWQRCQQLLYGYERELGF